MERTTEKTMARKRRGSGTTSGETSISNGKKKNKQHGHEADMVALHESIGYSSMSLVDVHDRIQVLCRKVPEIPENGFELVPSLGTSEKPAVAIDATSAEATTATTNTPQEASVRDPASEKGISAAAKSISAAHDYNETIPNFLPRPSEPCRYNRKALREWATALQTVLEEFYLLVALVSPATYRWGAERSGAAEQNLSLLSNEFVRSQEQITARVTTRLNDVLAPVVTLVTEKTITTKDRLTEEEVKRNYFVTTYEDPDYVHLAYTILARNSSLLRQIVLANFDKLLRAISDYLTATKKDSQHDARGLVY